MVLPKAVAPSYSVPPIPKIVGKSCSRVLDVRCSNVYYKFTATLAGHHPTRYKHSTIPHSTFLLSPSALTVAPPRGCPAISTSPTAQRPADQTNSKELMQKKLIVCPISNHDPVSVTFRKNVIVITVARKSAFQQQENNRGWSTYCL